MMELQILKDWARAKLDEHLSKDAGRFVPYSFIYESCYNEMFKKALELETMYFCMSLREAGYDEPA